MKKKKDNIFKATIFIRLSSGECVHGEGTVEAVRSSDNKDALFTARFYKPFPKKKRK